ncbi:flippase-like domain-containing protein [Cryobacterium sp. 1639]|uniref:lysylphosphatidylglycerol synthase transmembrane domain-containing protein n=1 Tax=Cryobacterium inferilacus TaxID=2866629 RepID=UPI001C735C35|nr:lysylphosphatidylglycerol synthase transmembrane domain-containing protein [Cryobacterium sp. 1639]MBX0301944.1 flippase-like domain-containing protein [Cryobacterium sp. 1639]
MLSKFGRTRAGLTGLALVGGSLSLTLNFGAYLDGVGRAIEVAGAFSLHFWTAVILVLLGHGLRAQRTRLAINNAFPAPWRAHFGALSVGYFFGAILPFRLGEVIRTWLLARRLRISLLYTFATVALERVLDIALISFLFLAGTFLFPGTEHSALVTAAVVALVGSLAVILVFATLMSGNGSVMKFVGWATSLFNPQIQGRTQFSAWTLIYGFQRLAKKPRQMVLYLGAFLGSWACYLTATAVLVLVLLPAFPIRETVSAAVGPFILAASSPWPAMPDSYVGILGELDVPDASAILLGSATWFALAIPIAVIGLIWTPLYSVRVGRGPQSVVQVELPGNRNKLDRSELSGRDFPKFLNAYFRGESLFHVLHELEVRGDLTLVRVFKGGSNAVAVLSRQGGELSVQKLVPRAHAEKLKMQYDWLIAHGHHDRIVQVIGDSSGDAFYSIELEYCATSVPMFEFIHVNPVPESERKLTELWAFMFDNIYTVHEPALHADELEQYVQERFVERVNAVATVHDDLARALEGEFISINGRTYSNFHTVMATIRQSPEAWSDLCTYQASDAIHGDLTIDNILIDRAADTFTIIDPSDDNKVRGPVLDFARQFQSLRMGYEFLNLDESPVSLGTDAAGQQTIEFPTLRSEQYVQLEEFLFSEIAIARLTPGELRSIDFHVGLLYGRMLSHRVVMDPETVLRYYATCVVGLNRFASQYTPVRSAL